MARICASLCLAALALLGTVSAAQATYPADNYNIDGVTHNAINVQLKSATIGVLDSWGNPLTAAGGAVPNTSTKKCGSLDPPCAQVQGIETTALLNGHVLYYTWPGVDATGKINQSMIDRSNIKSPPSTNVDFAKCNGLTRGSNCLPTINPGDAPGSPQYSISPQSIGADQRYYSSLCEKSWGYYCYFSPYGQPFTNANYTIMSWSWVKHAGTQRLAYPEDLRVTGGGIARGVLPTGAIFYPSDVSPIVTQTRNPSTGAFNGTVTARFGRVRLSNGFNMYGWVVMNHVYGTTCTSHVLYAGGGAALSDTMCP